MVYPSDMVSHHCSLQIFTANRAGKSPSDHGGSAGGDSWVSSPVTLALICAPVFWRRSVFCGEDWNWISGIAGSISGISSRISCWIFMDFRLKIGISMDFMQDLYHWNLDFTMKLWCLFRPMGPHEIDRGMTSVDLRLDCLVYMAEKCAELIWVLAEVAYFQTQVTQVS